MTQSTDASTITTRDAPSRSTSPALSVPPPPTTSLFKPPSLPSSRSFPSLVTLASASSLSFSPASSPSSSCFSTLLSSTLALRRATSDLCRLGNQCFVSRDYDGAVNYYTQALDLNIEDPRTWNNRGTCYVAKKLYRMGIRDYDEAITRLPACGEFYYHRGVAYSALKKYADAIQDYTRCIELHASHANAYNNRGNAYRIQRQYKLAHADLQQAVQLEPSSQLYQRNLKRVEQALTEEAKSDKQAWIMDLEAILHQILLPRGARESHPAFISVTSQLESLLRTLIENTTPKNTDPASTSSNTVSVSSSTQTTPLLTVRTSNDSVITPLLTSMTDSPIVPPLTPSSLFGLTDMPQSPSMAAVIARLPPQLINSLLQLVQEKRVAMKELERRRDSKKRVREFEMSLRLAQSLRVGGVPDSDDSDDGRVRNIKRVRVSTSHSDHLYDNDDGSVDEEVGLASPQSSGSSDNEADSQSPRSQSLPDRQMHSEPIIV